MGKIYYFLCMMVSFPYLVFGDSFGNFTESRFVPDDYLCTVEQRLKLGYSWLAPETKFTNDVFCLSECSKDKECIGASIVNSTSSYRCYLHGFAPPFMKCNGEKEPNHEYWAKYCRYGAWNSENQECSCFSTASGKRCDKFPRNCRALSDSGYVPTKPESVFLDPMGDGKHPFKIECALSGLWENQSTFVTMINNGSGDFNKTWQEYEHGFGDINSFNSWLGLWKWHYLSSYGGCTTAILTLDLGYGFLFHRSYSDFVVSGPQQNYAFSYESTWTSFTNANDGKTTATPALGNISLTTPGGNISVRNFSVTHPHGNISVGNISVTPDYGNISVENISITTTDGNIFVTPTIAVTAPNISFGDCLTNHVGEPFSTWDRDNDEEDDVNCASRAGSGWWYDDGEQGCNLLGQTEDAQSKLSLNKYQKLIVDGVDLSLLGQSFKYYVMIVVHCWP